MGENGLLLASVDARGDALYSGEATRPCSGGEDWYGAKSMLDSWRESVGAMLRRDK